MSPPAQPPPPPQLLAHMPQIPAPCLNRCSINNACFSATHLPGAQSGKRRVGEGDATKWMSLLRRGTRGTKNGRGPRSLSDYWEMDWPHQKKLKDQWTWGWSVLLVPSAPNSGSKKKCSVLLQPKRDLLEHGQKRIKSGVQSEGLQLHTGRLCFRVRNINFKRNNVKGIQAEVRCWSRLHPFILGQSL